MKKKKFLKKMIGSAYCNMSFSYWVVSKTTRW